jgi:hypothetical protein
MKLGHGQTAEVLDVKGGVVVDDPAVTAEGVINSETEQGLT